VVQQSPDLGRQLRPTWSPWRAVVGFGLVSLAADMVYEGARSITGPLLAGLGASAVLVGLVTGAGEAMALLLRLVSGTWADRTGRYWTLTIVGYGLTAICVPALAVTPFLAGGGLVVACCLILAERTGKAIRSPAKTALLARAASGVGLGRGFAVHKALDQLGAVAGPLLVAAVLAATGLIWPAMALLVVPGAAAIVLLVWIRHRTAGADVEAGEEAAETDAPSAAVAPSVTWFTTLASGFADLPARFWWFALSSGATTAGLVTFGVISYHLTRDQVVPVPVVPVVYAAAMGSAAVAALVTGWAYDRIKGRVLLALPLLVVAVPALAFAASPVLAIVGVVLWGAATGVQDSTVKALVADLVPAARRATAYGAFAAVQGVTAIAGGLMAGALYETSIPLLIAAVAATQVLALGLLVVSLSAARPRGSRAR
jgi:MFS family permease